MKDKREGGESLQTMMQTWQLRKDRKKKEQEVRKRLTLQNSSKKILAKWIRCVQSKSSIWSSG